MFLTDLKYELRGEKKSIPLFNACFMAIKRLPYLP